MSSRKNYKKLIVEIITLIILGLILSSVSIAASVKKSETIGDLIDCTRDDSWYEFKPEDVIGNKIAAGVDMPTDKARWILYRSTSRL